MWHEQKNPNASSVLVRLLLMCQIHGPKEGAVGVIHTHILLTKHPNLKLHLIAVSELGFFDTHIFIIVFLHLNKKTYIF